MSKKEKELPLQNPFITQLKFAYIYIGTYM